MARSPDRTLDFSAGDPLLPLTRVANYAFRQSARDINLYQAMNQAGLGQPVGEILYNISRHFTARGFYPDGWSGLGTRGLLMTGGGTTEAYELIIRALAEDVRYANQRRSTPIRPVIVMPTPTYGFFFENPKNWGIEVVKIERDWRDDGQLDAKKLLALFQSLEKDGKRVVAYYDCNPHNPLGTIRTRKETENVAGVIAWQNRRYREQDEHRSEGLSSQINIIDDMIYSGLEYADQEPAFGFAQLEREAEFTGIFKNTLTLFGPSKAGLVNLRAGLVIGHDRHIDSLRKIQQTTSYFPPKLSMHALEAFYSDKKTMAGWRHKHFEQLNEAHRFAGVLMKALVNGVDDAGEISAADHTRLADLIPDSKRLQRGIPGIRVITKPQAGFFHLLDFSGLEGRGLRDSQGALSDVFTGEESIDFLSRRVGLRFAYGSWAGLNHEDGIVRASFAKPLDEIVEFARRVEAMAGQCYPLPQKRKAKRDSVNSTPRCQAG
ncbi:MAG: pyridoxal phosphate-dependent aminotransferase [Micavibrio sp.]